MTIETTDGSGDPVLKSGPYNGDGSTSSFDYDFQIQDEEELLVTRQNADGTETVLTLTTDYTVSGVDSDTGGSITLTDPANDLPTGTKLVIQYNGLYSQTTDYSNQGRIKLEILEKSLDKVMMHLRSLKEAADRAVAVDTFGTADVDTLRANINALAAIESDITTVADDIAVINAVSSNSTNINTVAAIDANVTAVANIAANVTTVANNIASVNTVAANDADISTVAGVSAAVSTVASDITNINTVAASIDDVNRYAEEYTIAATAPAAPSAGDFWYDSANNVLKFYDGTAWVDYAGDAASSASDASDSADAAAASFDSFDDRYLGAKSSEPSTDNDGDPLVEGALFFDTTTSEMKVYDGSAWEAAYTPASSYVPRTSSTGSAELPAGTTAQRDGAPSAGYLRFNTSDGAFEGHDGTDWEKVIRSGDKASDAEGEAGTDNEKYMTPQTTLAAIDANVVDPIAIAQGAPGAPKIENKALAGTFLGSVAAETNVWAGLSDLDDIEELFFSGDSFIGSDNNDMQVRFSTDNGATWGSPYTLVSSNYNISTHGIQMNLSDGSYHIAYGSSSLTLGTATIPVGVVNAVQFKVFGSFRASFVFLAYATKGKST